MTAILLIVGIILTAISGLTLLIGFGHAARVRIRLREHGASMPPMRAEVIVLGAWTIALAIGVWMIWKSQHL